MTEAFVSPEVLEQRLYEQEREAIKAEREEAIEFRKIRLEVVRLAKETLLENSKSKLVDERDVSADDIKNFANTLYTFTIS